MVGTQHDDAVCELIAEYERCVKEAARFDAVVRFRDPGRLLCRYGSPDLWRLVYLADAFDSTYETGLGLARQYLPGDELRFLALVVDEDADEDEDERNWRPNAP